jgi:hypothetical protein
MKATSRSHHDHAHEDDAAITKTTSHPRRRSR